MTTQLLITIIMTIGFISGWLWALGLQERIAILERQVRRQRDDFAQYRHDQKYSNVPEPPRSIY